MREFTCKDTWDAISENQKWFAQFMREFKDKVDWDSVSLDQQMSEDFMGKCWF